MRNSLRIARQLPYRDFMTAGLLVPPHDPAPRQGASADNGMPPDNWIYIQEPDVKIGRLQVFNNWSPALVADPGTIWLGLEYFCREGDALWSHERMRVRRLRGRGAREDRHDRRGATCSTALSCAFPRHTPPISGEYRRFGEVRAYLDGFANLYPIGRNGMHRYNNQDHSMLAAEHCGKLHRRSRAR